MFDECHDIFLDFLGEDMFFSKTSENSTAHKRTVKISLQQLILTHVPNSLDERWNFSLIID